MGYSVAFLVKRILICLIGGAELGYYLPMCYGGKIRNTPLNITA